MSDKIRIFALGGLDEAGKNLTVIEINDDIFVLDCGLKYPNKNTPGIDCIIPNPDYLVKNKDRVKCYIITHAHTEQIGALPYFYRKVPAPIYTTKATANIIEIVAPPIDKKIKYDYVFVKPTSNIIIANREFRLFQTCHNTLDSFGLAISTDKGYIVYTGEFIVDHEKKYSCFNFDMPALAKISDSETFLLLAESYGANSTGYCSPYHKFTPHVVPYFTEAQGRIFVAGFFQNFYGVFEFLELAMQYNRKIAFYDKATKNIVKILMNSGMINIPESNLIDYSDILRYPKKELMILMLGRTATIFNDVNNLCHKKNEDKRIFLNEEDTFILATPPNDNVEDEFTKTVDELFKTGAKVAYLKRKMVASMHAREEDLKFILSYLKPKYYLPVRGSYSQMLANAKLALSMKIGLTHNNVFILDNGMVLNFDENGKPSIKQDASIDVSEVVVDGEGINKASLGTIEERSAMAEGGVVVISSTISKSKRKMVTKPDCQMRGFVFVKDAEPLLKEITAIYNDEIALEFKNNPDGFDNELVCQNITDRASKSIQRHLRRNPLIVPIIIEIE